VAEADIQALIDGVAIELGAPIGLCDPDDRVLAHTAHEDVVDEVRRAGIMHRRTPADLFPWFEQWGIRTATSPIRTPADAARGILARWCVPVRFRGSHLGYLWVLDAGEVAESALGPAVEAAAQIAALLYRQRLTSQVDTDLLRLLLIPNPENERVAEEAREIGTYMHTGPVAVVVASALRSDELSALELSDLTLAVRRAAEQKSSNDVLGGVISGVGVLLAPLRSHDDAAPAWRLAESVRRLAAHINDDLDVTAAIGRTAELEYASYSYADARRALRMARAMPDLGPIVAWDDLGVFRALALLPTSDIESGAIDPRVRKLLTNEVLAPTAETFLDLAGDMQQTATRLFVHRATLYQRLDRIKVLYNLDVRHRGDHRLITHLGLKLARAAGGSR
jgi:sugar diacid utilization regulator